MLRVCAWHRRYFGYPRLLGIRLERRLRVAVTGGQCDGCAALFRSGAGPLPWWPEVKRLLAAATCVVLYVLLALLWSARAAIEGWLP